MDNERLKVGKISSGVGIGLNILLATLKLVIGIMSGLVSVIADAINNYSDATSGIVSLIGFKLSSRPADEEHPFGHARYEYISGFVVAFLVLLAGAELLKSSIEKIVKPEEVVFSVWIFVVLGISIIVKLVMAIVNYRLGKKLDSNTLIAVSQDSRNDVIATTAILVATVIFKLTGFDLDGIMGVAVALFVLYSGVGLIKDTITDLLGKAPSIELAKKIEEKIMSYEGVLGTHDLMVHDYGPGRRFASVHVEVPAERPVLECHEIIDKIEEDFAEEFQMHLVIHYDPIVTTNEEVGSIRKYLKDQARIIDDTLSIHDLRIVPGVNNTNVIFDCVVPYSCKVKEDEIKKILNEKLAEEFPHHTAVIKIDRSFVEIN